MSIHPVRTSAKALIIHEGNILVNKMKGKDEDFYILPGGGQHLNENLHKALKRELLEEVGAEVRIKDLVLVREYISNNHEFKDMHPDFHSINMIFTCDLLNFNNFSPSTEPDERQIGFEWIPVKEMHKHKIYPLSLRKKIQEINEGISLPLYVGDVN